MPPDKTFSKLFDGTSRGAAGDVCIRFEEITHVKLAKVVRPIFVFGNVVVCGTSSRKPAPSPISGMSLTGIPDAHKGHLMALELGGPDDKANIVPQWAGWQSSGDWRKMEVAVKKDAEKMPKGSYLFYCVAVIYYKGFDLRLLDERRLNFPQGFIVTTQVMKGGKLQGPIETRFKWQQEQDKTDDLMALREFIKADQEEEPTLTAGSMYSDTRSVTRKGMEKLKWAKSGPGGEYRPVPPVTYSLGDIEMTSLASSHLTDSRAASALPRKPKATPKKLKPPQTPDDDMSDVDDEDYDPMTD